MNREISKNQIIRIKKPSKLKKTTYKLLCVLFVIVLLVGVSLVVKALFAWGNITVKNQGTSSPFLKLPTISAEALAGEGDGRINILLMGIGGEKHPGGNLTDTIIIASVDPKNKSMAMLSLPRDLLVPIPKPFSGQEKINAIHSYGEQNKDKIPGGGPTLLKTTISDILDLKIHYFIRLDFQGFKDIIDTIEGVDLNIEKAINDPLYPAPNMRDYDPFYISAGNHHLDGEVALKYVRSRQTTSDFDRAKRQQEVLSAVKDKSLSVGIVSNPRKISDLIKVLGNHIQTDFTATEIERFFKIIKEIKSSDIITKVLDNSPDGPLTNYNNGGYYLVPKTGDFKEIQRIAHEIFSDPFLKEENATIAVLNGSGKAGNALEVANKLKTYNYKVNLVEVSPVEIETTTLYSNSDTKKDATMNFLKNRVNAQIKTTLDKSIIDSAGKNDIILVIGKDYTGGKQTK